MAGNLLGHHPTAVAIVRTGIDGRVTVDHLLPGASKRHANAIPLTRYRGKVGDHQQGLAILAPAQPGINAVGRIIANQPLKALRYIILLIQRRLLAVQPVQVTHQLLHAPVLGVLQQIPVQLLIMVPFAPLAEFAAHKQQFLARMRPHKAQIGTQVGEFLPAISGHLVDQRVLAMHHFIMGNRQDKAFGPGIDQAKAQLVVMVGAVHRVLLDVVQRIVHPAHVPFVGKPQSALIGALADAGPGRGLFGNHQCARHFAGNHIVEMAQKLDGFEVFPPAMTVGHPFPGLARIIAVQHRGHCIHAQPVDMEMLEPMQRRSQHKAMYLGAAQVVNQGIPVLMKAFKRVGVFVQRRAIKLRQPVGIVGKMRRHPVQNHADTGHVTGIDERGKIIWRAITGRRRKLRQGLITPGTTERVLHDRHQLDMGEAQLLHIRDQAIRQLRPGVLAGDITDIIDLTLP